MKKYISLIMCLLIISPIYAQEKNCRKGKKAIQFDFNGLNLSGTISGIAGKYWWRNNLAIRAGLQFENLLYEDNYENYDQTDRDGIITNIKLLMLVENHFQPSKKISPYLGGKIGFSFNRSEETKKPSGEKDIKNKIIGFYYSLSVLFGIEYWLNKNISLSGHHEIYFEHGLSKTKGDYDPYEYTKKNIKSTTSRLILSIYF